MIIFPSKSDDFAPIAHYEYFTSIELPNGNVGSPYGTIRSPAGPVWSPDGPVGSPLPFGSITFPKHGT